MFTVFNTDHGISHALKQYIPSKPDRYGLKAFALVDASSFYTKKLELHAGKQPVRLFSLETKPALIVKRLAQPIFNSGRNITMVKWFSSVPLRKNNADIPPEFVNTKGRAPCSSLFGYRNQRVLVSYVPKKKNVILISSMHNCGEIDQQSGSKQKPDVITYYNKTKCGVACVDQMRAPYTVARCSCRPLTVFFALMDIAAINSQIVYRSNHNITVERREFLKILSKSLTRPWLEKRLKIRNLSFEIINIIQKKSLYH